MVAAVVSVNGEVPEPEMGLAPNTALAPDGSPETVNVTAPEKPPSPATVIPVLAEPPGTVFSVEGEAVREKSPVLEPVTVSATETLFVMAPLTPVTVTM